MMNDAAKMSLNILDKTTPEGIFVNPKKKKKPKMNEMVCKIRIDKQDMDDSDQCNMWTDTGQKEKRKCF